MKDFLGNELAVGDTVIYASLAGRSAKLTKGKIVAFKASGVQVQREATSNGSKVGKRTRYINSRTGKGIDPSYAKHQVRGWGYENQKTGEFLQYEDFYRRKWSNYDAWDKAYRESYGGYYGYKNRVSLELDPEFVESDWNQTQPIYKDYVTEVEKDPPPVTVGTHSMLKVEGAGWPSAWAAEES